MDELRRHYSKWNKSDRPRHSIWYHLCAESKKIWWTSEYNKKYKQITQTHRYREETSGYQLGVKRGEEQAKSKVRVGGQEKQMCV